MDFVVWLSFTTPQGAFLFVVPCVTCAHAWAKVAPGRERRVDDQVFDLAVVVEGRSLASGVGVARRWRPGAPPQTTGEDPCPWCGRWILPIATASLKSSSGPVGLASPEVLSESVHRVERASVLPSRSTRRLLTRR